MMSIREQALSILADLNECDLQVFISLFGKKNQGAASVSEKMKAFDELDALIESIPPFSEDFDEKTELDNYFKEKYSL